MQDLRLQLNGEHCAILNIEVSAARQEAIAMRDTALAESREVHEMLEREQMNKIEKLDMENIGLHGNVGALEHQIVSMNILKREEQEEMILNHINDMSDFIKTEGVRHENDMCTITAKVNVEMAKAVEVLEAHHTHRFQEMNEHLTALELQAESSKDTIASLEKNVIDLGIEKSALSNEININMRNLQHEIDCRYDLERNAMEKAKEYSLTTSQLSTEAHRMKLQYEGIILKEEEIKGTMLIRLSGTVLLGLQLSYFFKINEDLREKIEASLKSYRVTDLSHLNMTIKQTETDRENLKGDT